MLVAIQEGPDGRIVIHTPSQEGAPGQVLDATTPDALWSTVQGLLADPDVPQVDTESTTPGSVEEALASAAGKLLNDLIRTTGPKVAPIVKQAAQNAGTRATGILSRLGKADLGVPRYPRGS